MWANGRQLTQPSPASAPRARSEDATAASTADRVSSASRGRPDDPEVGTIRATAGSAGRPEGTRRQPSPETSTVGRASARRSRSAGPGRRWSTGRREASAAQVAEAMLSQASPGGSATATTSPGRSCRSSCVARGSDALTAQAPRRAAGTTPTPSARR